MYDNKCLANNIKGRKPLSTSVSGFTPTDIFYAFGIWINSTHRALVQNKLYYSEQITSTVSQYRAAHDALPVAVIRAELTNERDNATRLGIAVVDLRKKFIADLN